MLEVLDRERAAEREDHRVERDAEPDDVPVGAIEAPQVAPDDAIGRRGLLQVESLARRAAIEHVVDDAADDSSDGEARRQATAAAASRGRRAA